MHLTPHTNKKNSNKGFTLVELVVSISIMVLILTVILVNYRKFDSGIVLTNLAYDMGLSVRETQTYGISVKGKVVGADQNFDYGYGIHFTSTGGGRSYFIFADIDGNHKYTVAQDAVVKTYNIQGGFKVKDLCTNDTSIDTCGFNTMDITFKRPDPDSTLYIGNGNSLNKSTEIAVVKITSIQDLSATKSVLVRSTGQITIREN